MAQEVAQEEGEECVCRTSRYFFGVMMGCGHVIFRLAKLGCIASMVAIVVEEAKVEGVVGAEAEEHALGKMETGGAREEFVSFEDRLTEALLVFLATAAIWFLSGNW